MTALPNTLDGAVAMLLALLSDRNLGLGIATFIVILVVAVPVAWALVTWAHRP